MHHMRKLWRSAIAKHHIDPFDRKNAAQGGCGLHAKEHNAAVQPYQPEGANRQVALLACDASGRGFVTPNSKALTLFLGCPQDRLAILSNVQETSATDLITDTYATCKHATKRLSYAWMFQCQQNSWGS